jgi:hypothetical protein
VSTILASRSDAGASPCTGCCLNLLLRNADDTQSAKGQLVMAIDCHLCSEGWLSDDHVCGCCPRRNCRPSRAPCASTRLRSTRRQCRLGPQYVQFCELHVHSSGAHCNRRDRTSVIWCTRHTIVSKNTTASDAEVPILPSARCASCPNVCTNFNQIKPNLSPNLQPLRRSAHSGPARHLGWR